MEINFYTMQTIRVGRRRCGAQCYYLLNPQCVVVYTWTSESRDTSYAWDPIGSSWSNWLKACPAYSKLL